MTRRCGATLMIAMWLSAGCGSKTPTSPTTPAQTEVFLSFTSPAGDYIGQGQSRRLTPDAMPFSAVSSCAGNRIEIRIGEFTSQWRLTLAAARGSSLGVGTYDGATRYPFQAATLPGLDFSGESRGCNQLSGRFTISELLVAPDGGIERLRATFQQTCENTMPTLTGEVRLEVTPRMTPSACII